MKRILAALDFSEVSASVAERAAALAGAFGAELILLHVAAEDPAFVGYGAGPDTVRDDRARELRDEHRRLQELAEDLRGRGVAAKALLVEGPSVEKILDEAERLRADAIVIGSHGHTALYRVLLGSVSEGVVRKSPRPVLLVPSARRD